MKSPVKVIGKSGNTLKLIDKKGHIITINDITLKNYKVGDIIK